jgi:hypothetical protein
MKLRITLFAVLSVCLFAAFQCNKENGLSGCYKGRLEIKGICLNYTIKVLDGNIDTSLVQSSWTDPHTGSTYQNVFALGSPCNFPSDIEAGDEFYFKIENSPQNCAVCLAYYPTPQKSLSITASKLPCH